MKKYLINSLIILLIFTVTAVFSVFSFATTQGALITNIGLNKGFGLVITFIVIFFIALFSLRFFKKRIGLYGILITMGVTLVALILMNLTTATIKFTYKSSPYYMTWIFALIAGWHFYSRDIKKFQLPMILAIFPIVMTLGAYELWFHRIEYGNWTGEVSAEQVGAFELINKDGEVVNNESLKGKIIMFDFWFISCGPCWVKFPELQRVYEQYESNSSVEIYAVNRPMKRDKPGELFSRIEDKGYSFPVLAGRQEVMDALGVYKYPSVMIINQNGEMVFMGELEDAEQKLKSMLDQ